jgi:hypothetical protein
MKRAKFIQTLSLALYVFMISSITVFIFTEIAILRYKCGVEISCYTWHIERWHIYYWSVYFIVSFVYSARFYYLLKLDKAENLRKILRHLYLVTILFIVGLTLYAANKRYWKIWLYKDFWFWWLIVSAEYLYFLITQSTAYILWLVASMFITYLSLDDKAKAVAKRPLQILLTLYAIVCAFIFYNAPSSIEPISIASATITVIFIYLIIFCIYKQSKSKRSTPIAMQGETNATDSNSSI